MISDATHRDDARSNAWPNCFGMTIRVTVNPGRRPWTGSDTPTCCWPKPTPSTSGCRRTTWCLHRTISGLLVSALDENPDRTGLSRRGQKGDQGPVPEAAGRRSRSSVTSVDSPASSDLAERRSGCWNEWNLALGCWRGFRNRCRTPGAGDRGLRRPDLGLLDGPGTTSGVVREAQLPSVFTGERSPLMRAVAGA